MLTRSTLRPIGVPVVCSAWSQICDFDTEGQRRPYSGIGPLLALGLLPGPRRPPRAAAASARGVETPTPWVPLWGSVGCESAASRHSRVFLGYKNAMRFGAQEAT